MSAETAQQYPEASASEGESSPYLVLRSPLPGIWVRIPPSIQTLFPPQSGGFQEFHKVLFLSLNISPVRVSSSSTLLNTACLPEPSPAFPSWVNQLLPTKLAGGQQKVLPKQVYATAKAAALLASCYLSAASGDPFYNQAAPSYCLMASLTFVYAGRISGLRHDGHTDDLQTTT